MNEEQYFERFREVDAGVKADMDRLASEIRDLPEDKKRRMVGPFIIVFAVLEKQLEELRQLHYQRAMSELRDIETSAKQDMNRLGNQRR